MLYLIGDNHGKWSALIRIVEEIRKYDRTSPIVQIGDFGLGFGRNPESHNIDPVKRFGFIRGNHDNPADCRVNPNYLGEFAYFDEQAVKQFNPAFKELSHPPFFFISGAYSVDWRHRVPGHTWWSDEELSPFQLRDCEKAYLATKPHLVVTHEAPSSAAEHLLKPMLVDSYFGMKAEGIKSRTASAFEELLKQHRPKMWVFGHYHYNTDFVLDGTHFICLAEHSVMSVNRDFRWERTMRGNPWG